MDANQHTAEQIIKILEQAEKREQIVAALCRKYGIAENTSTADARPTAGCH